MADFLVTPRLLAPDLVETVTDADIVALEPRYHERSWRELPAEIKGITLELSAIQIMDGLTGFLQAPSSAVYVIATVVDGISNQPITFHGQTYRGIEEGQLLPLGPTDDPTAALTVYLREGTLPRALSFCLLVVRSNQALRDLGSLTTTLMADDRYTKLATLATAAATAANPAFGTILTVAQETIGLAAEYLKVKPDDQLGYYQVNFTNRFHDLGVGPHPPGGKTMEVDKIRCSYLIRAS